jgi:glycosyltransferase involved in cell wall biosynthesis
MLRLAHIAQEDSRLPATAETLGSLTRVVHELTIRLARRWPLVLYSTRHERSAAADERLDGIRHVRFSPDPEPRLFMEYFRWRNRIGRRLGIAERRYPASRAYYWSYIRRVARHAAAERPDVIHLHNVTQFVPPLRRALPRARMVLQMHCEWLVELPRATVARRLADVDLVLGVSRHVVRQIQTVFPELAAPCRVLHNGVDLSVFPPRERVAAERADAIAALRSRLCLRGPVVLYVGRLSSEKGVHVLLEAFARIRERQPHATCIVIGPDWGPERTVRPRHGELARLDRDYMAHLRRLAAPHGPRVVFVGPVPNRELSLYHAVADVVAAPSLLEAFGIPVLEAGASGVPVVASAIGGLEDTVVPGKTGVIVPPGDAGALATALEDVLADPARARAFGRAAREHVAAQFTWDHVADVLAGYYEALCAAGAAGKAA